MNKQGGSLSAEQMQTIESVLAGYVKDAGIKTVLLVDPDGHLVCQSGAMDTIDPVSFGALVSANFASTQQIAGQMGEKEFNAFYIQGKEKDLYVSAVEDKAILVSIFARGTTVGMVKIFAEKTVKEISANLVPGEGGDQKGLSVGGGFADSALAELDKVLGGI